jgi:D-amino-acid dehydrogenase
VTHESAVTVVGAGIVGACVAYELRRRGARVTLVDAAAPGHGCSFGNSGAVSVGSVAPLAMPGIVRTVPRMLLDPAGPLRIRLGYLPRALPWLVRFASSATWPHAEETARVLAALHEGALERHRALTAEIGAPELLLSRGHLHVYPDEAALAKDAAGWELRARHGVQFERLDRDGVHALEPSIGARYRIGVFLADHATIVNPLRYVERIVAAFVARGGTLVRARVHALTPAGAGWRCEGAADVPASTHVVVAAGMASKALLAPLRIRVQLESQRGYHVTWLEGRSPVSRTVVLADHKIFVTPMEEGLRVGGTVEIAGLERPPDPTRYAQLEAAATAAFGPLRGTPSQWMGHRPCTPDSRPLIGAAPGVPGVWLATGHGHLGLTQSVTTAARIADAVLAAA